MGAARFAHKTSKVSDSIMTDSQNFMMDTADHVLKFIEMKWNTRMSRLTETRKQSLNVMYCRVHANNGTLFH